MTARTRVLAYVLVAAAVLGLGYLGYTQVYKPLKLKNEALASLEQQLTDKQLQLLADVRNNQRLAAVMPRSLPANRELAEAEYETMLSRLFRDAKLSPKWAKQTQSETDPAPDLNATATAAPGTLGGAPGGPSAPGGGTPGGFGKAAAKPAYTKLIYSMTLEKVDLPKVTEFLALYHKVPLLHQIVRFSIKHTTTTGPMGVNLAANKRNDLTVTLVSEAVILEGAPDRKTLYDVPDSFAAALGGPLLHALRNDTEKSRSLTPAPDPAFWALATEPRDYALLAARDVFHGPLPEYPKEKPKPIKVDPPDPVPPPPPTPPDATPYIYLASMVRTTDPKARVAQADIVDRFHDMFYTLTFTQSGERMSVEVMRFRRDVKTDPKTKEVESSLVRDRDHPWGGGALQLSDRAGKEFRTFKVYGLAGNAIVLGEKEKAPEPQKEKSGKGNKGRPAPAKPPATDPRLGAVGGLAALKPQVETFYKWEVSSSKPLKELKPLTDKEAKAALAEAAYGLLDGVPPPVKPVTPAETKPTTRQPAVETAPAPRTAGDLAPQAAAEAAPAPRAVGQ